MAWRMLCIFNLADVKSDEGDRLRQSALAPSNVDELNKITDGLLFFFKWMLNVSLI